MHSKAEIAERLSALKEELQVRYPIASLAFFGSSSREDAGAYSDIDILVEFNGKIGSDFIRLADEIEEALGEKVDLVSKNGLKQKYLDAIASELVYV